MSLAKERRTKRRMRQLKSELKFLRSYLSEIETAVEEYKVEWTSDYVRVLRELDIPHPLIAPRDDDAEAPPPHVGFVNEEGPQVEGEDVEEDFDDYARDNTPEWAKKLFKRIALLTHPDRVSDEDDSKRLGRIFNKARDALSESDLDTLLSIAMDLNIESNLPAEEVISRAEKNLASTKRRIEEIENSVAWLWGENVDDDVQRIKIMCDVLVYEGFRDFDPNRVAEVVESLVS